MAAFAGFTQGEDGAACHHFAAVLQEDADQVFQITQLGLAVDQRHHVDTESVLQLGLFVEVVEHHLRHRATLEFDHQAHARFVGLVLDVADVFDLLLVHQLGHAFLQGLLIYLVGQFVDDDRLALTFVNVFKVALGAHHHTAATGAVTVFDAAHAVNNAGGREVGRGNDLHQIVDRRVGMAEHMQTGVDHFVQVVRRDIGGHTYGNARRAVDQQIRNAAWKDERFFFRAVVVGAEIDGFFVDVAQHFVGDFGETDLGVTHRRSVVSVDRAEVALAVDQHMAQREILGHTDDGVVHRTVAMRVVLTDHVTHDTGRFFVRTVPVVVEFVHGEQNATVHRF